MSRHDDSITLRQMLEHIEEAVSLTKGRTEADIGADRVLFLALLKLVEIVGEAATRISVPMQAAHPEIPWREIIGTRNRLIHGYDSVDHNILWDIVTADFPSLAAQVRAALNQ
ncbi:MAG: HepT-like ribonuclease domain-containing protein [bacterium]